MTDNELNALVAERVMGCLNLAVGLDNRLVCLCRGFPHGEDTSGHIPDYANDIAAAWQVVEKLLIAVRPIPADDGSVKWGAAQVVQLDDGIGTWIAVGWSVSDTAPRAICLAALKAAGVEVGVFAVAVDATGDLYGGGG